MPTTSTEAPSELIRPFDAELVRIKEGLLDEMEETTIIANMSLLMFFRAHARSR